MKLFNQFNVIPRYLTAFNYAGLNLNETPQELEKCTPEFQNFWDKECRKHPTNKNFILMDEPTALLDSSSQLAVLEIIKGLTKNKRN